MYSFTKLQCLFKNTEETPVIIEDEDIDGGMAVQKREENAVQKKVEDAVQENMESGNVEDGIDEKAEEGDNIDEGIEKEHDFVGDVEFGADADCVVPEEEQFEVESDSEGVLRSSEERMALSSCDEADSSYPQFNENADMEDPKFRLAMVFSSGQAFRDVVRKHAIVHQRAVRLKKNQIDRIRWIRCAGCEWKVYATKQKRSTSFQIKTLEDLHTCSPTWDQKQLTSTWIANHYEDDIRLNPTWPAAAFRARVINDLKCNINDSMIYRALRKAKMVIQGKHEDEFKKLYDYGNELLKAMPTSTVKVMTETAMSGTDAVTFKRFLSV